jgi:mRNA interferase RelE/StbE
VRCSPPRTSAASSRDRTRRLELHRTRPPRHAQARPTVQRRIIEALDRLVAEPPQGDIVKLTGIDEEWRLRVGDWRVRFTRDDHGIVQVLRVLPRGRAYDR